MNTEAPSAEILAHRKLFTAALRSGQYQQGLGRLHRAIVAPLSDLRQEFTGEWLHCCLGVACIVAKENGLAVSEKIGDGFWCYGTTGTEDPDTGDFGNESVLPSNVADWYGWDEDPKIPYKPESGEYDPEYDPSVYEAPAAECNDSKRMTFAQIADAFDNKYVLPFEPIQEPEGALEP